MRLVDGRPVNRPGLLGQPNDLTEFARVVEFNRPDALEEARRSFESAIVQMARAFGAGEVIAVPSLLPHAVFAKDAAVRAIRDWNPDIVFLDVRMPAMTGFELAQLIKNFEGA